MARLGINFSAAIRGNRDQVWTADLLWSRLRKDRILAIARETLGEAWAQAHGKDKKTDLAAAMQEAFSHGDGVPAGVTAEGRAAAIAWTPPGFRAFDTAAADDSSAADDAETTAPRPQTAVETPLGGTPEDSGDDAESGINPSGAAALASRVNGEVTPQAGGAAPEVIDPPAEDTGQTGHDAVRITIAGGGRDVSTEREQVLTPQRGNSHDNNTELPEIPAFLRRG